MYRKILVGGVTAAAVLGAGTAALATTGSVSTSGTPTSASSSTHAKTGKDGKAGKRKHSALARAAHAQITVKTKKGYVTHDLIRGTVTAVSATSITVQAGDKTSETFAITKTTKVVARAATKGAKPTASSIAKVTKGQHVLVSGVGTATLTADRVVDQGA